MVSHDYLHVVASDGVNLPVHRWRPPGARHAVVALHGATSHGGWFATLAEALAKRGIATYAPDRRGSGELLSLGLPETPAIWVEDLRRILVAIAADAARVTVLPWCFAVKLAVPALAEGAPADQLLCLAPAFFFSKQVGAGFKDGVAKAAEFPVVAPDEAFVSAPHARAFLANDPLRWRTMTRTWTELSAELLAKTKEVLPQLQLPMTAVFASGDRIADNVQGQRFAEAHRMTTHSVDGSHGFFLDDPEAAAAMLEPLIKA